MSQLSAPGNVLIKTTLMKSLLEVLWCTQPVFLSKHCTDNSRWLRDAQMIVEVPGTYTLLRWFSTTRNIPWGKEASRGAWLVLFLENIFSSFSVGCCINRGKVICYQLEFGKLFFQTQVGNISLFEKYASITAVDLIQWKKLDSWNLIQQKPELKLFNSLPFY